MQIHTRTRVNRLRALVLRLGCAALLMTGMGAGTGNSSRVVAAAQFASPALAAAWRADEAKLPGFWGPLAGATDGVSVPAPGTPNGAIQVQYFANGRMEIAADGTVTYGSLVTEMLHGMPAADSDPNDPNDTAPPSAPPDVPVAGTASVTYAALAARGQALFAPHPQGHGGISLQVAADGTPTDGGGYAGISLGPQATAYDAPTGHNVLGAFAAYRDQFGLDRIGYALSEPFRTAVTVGSLPTTNATVQLFERRVLVYAPTSATPFGVSTSEAGAAYYHWRYGTGSTDGPHTTVPFPSANDLLDTYYRAVNMRDFPKAYALLTDPAQSYAGFAAGYADTRNVQLLTGVTQPGADDTEARLPVYLLVANDNGDAYYSGCYRLRVSQFDPLAPRHYTILGGDLIPAFGVDSINDARILQSLSAACG